MDRAVKEPRVQIYHMGFLREKAAFYRKARVVLEGWFNRFDPRLEEGEKSNKPVWETECSFADLLVPFSGYIPGTPCRSGCLSADTRLPITWLDS